MCSSALLLFLMERPNPPRLVIYVDIDDVSMFECDIPIGNYVNLLISKMTWGTIDPISKEWSLVSDSPSVTPANGDDSLITYFEFVERSGKSRRGSPAEEKQWEQERFERLYTFTVKNQPGFPLKGIYDAWIKNLCVSMPVRKVFEIEKPDVSIPLPAPLGLKEGADLAAVQEACKYNTVHEGNIELFQARGFYRVSNAWWTLLLSLAREKKEFSTVLISKQNPTPDAELDEERKAEKSARVAAFLKEWTLFVNTQHVSFNGANRTKPAKFTGEKNTRDLRIFLDESVSAQVESSSVAEINAALPSLLQNNPRVATLTFTPASTASKTAPAAYSVSLSGPGVLPPRKPIEPNPLAGATVDPADAEASQKAEDIIKAGPGEVSPLDAGSVQGAPEAYVAIVRGLVDSAATKSAALILHNVDAPPAAEDTSPAQAVPPHVLVHPEDSAVHSIIFQSERAPQAKLVSAVTAEVLDAEKYSPETVLVVPQWQLASDPDVLVRALTTLHEAREARLEADRLKALEKAPPKPNPAHDPLGLKALEGKEYLLETVLPALLPAIEEVMRERPADPLTVIAFRLLEGLSREHEGMKLSV